MDALPTTPAALAACDDLRAVHVVALAHPEAAIVEAARAREGELAAAHDAAEPGSLPQKVVADFRAAYRRNLGACARTVTFADGVTLPATHPDVAKRLCSDVPADRAAAYAALNNVAHPANSAVLQDVRAAATRATEATPGKSWAEAQAEPFGGVGAITRLLDAYEASLAPAYASELAAFKAAAGTDSGAGELPLCDTTYLRAKVRAESGAGGAPIFSPLADALDAVARLLVFLGADSAKWRQDTWAGVPMHVLHVRRGVACGHV